jgi:hypothetical protein
MSLKQTDDENLDEQIDRIIEEDREIFDALDSWVSLQLCGILGVVLRAWTPTEVTIYLIDREGLPPNKSCNCPEW